MPMNKLGNWTFHRKTTRKRSAWCDLRYSKKYKIYFSLQSYLHKVTGSFWLWRPWKTAASSVWPYVAICVVYCASL